MCLAMGADLIIDVEGPGANGSSVTAAPAGKGGAEGGIEAGNVAARVGRGAAGLAALPEALALTCIG